MRVKLGTSVSREVQWALGYLIECLAVPRIFEILVLWLANELPMAMVIQLDCYRIVTGVAIKGSFHV